MTGLFWFDWPLLALSLANGIILLWLGLTVLLNAQRRTPGVVLLALAAWLGSAFFAAHTAILASGEGPASAALNLWWELGWLPLLALPLAWYAVVLWYSGLAAAGQGRRRWLPFALMSIFFFSLTAGLFAAGLPSFLDAVNLRFGESATLFGAPWFLVLYPLYILACLGLVYTALWRMPPATTPQRAAARERARPWLLVANTLLVVVALLVAAVMAWVARTADPLPSSGGGAPFDRDLPAVAEVWTAGADSIGRLALGIAWADLAISAVLAGVIFCVGYALVQYEIFSGRPLPRRALRRQWHEALLLAAGYGVVVGATLAAGWRPVYSLLLTALLMTLFFALLGWRTFAAQAEFVRRLQPFVVSTHLTEEMMQSRAAGTGVGVSVPGAAAGAARSAPDSTDSTDLSDPPNPATAATHDAANTFAALCEEVLETDYAVLTAAGALAPLVDTPLVYPARALVPASLPALSTAAHDALATAVADPGWPQIAWAVPLRGAQGPIGVLLLGRKRAGLYTEEEISIARAVGERLLDLLAAAALARRLLALTHAQWAEGQVADRLARRVLHDEVLPDLHAALILLVQGDEDALAHVRGLLTTVHRQTADLLRALPARPPTRPTGSLLDDLRRLVEEEMAGQFDAVSFAENAAAPATGARVSPLAAEVVFYAVRELVRNAARHGRGQAERPLTLSVRVEGGAGLSVVVEDDGPGMGNAAETAGSSQGLALHAAMLAVVGASLQVEPAPAHGVRATIRWPA
jgi:signal transduction histidine kinase